MGPLRRTIEQFLLLAELTVHFQGDERIGSLFECILNYLGMKGLWL
jgi:hypothetical protein